MITIHSLSEEKVKAAAQSLSRAFMNDPLQNYILPDANERSHKSPAHFEAVLRYGYLFGEIYAAQNMKGAVVWLPPRYTEISILRHSLNTTKLPSDYLMQYGIKHEDIFYDTEDSFVSEIGP